MASSCASLSRGPEAGQPRGDEGPPYPVTLGASDARRARSLAAWSSLLGSAAAVAVTSPGTAPPPELQPVTAAVRSLPPTPALFLPRVGAAGNDERTEEELRESLRRFLARATPLLGAEAATLALVSRTDDGPGGTRRALYRQDPFTYPLRGGYGLVEVTFAPDLRVTSLTSTAIPESDNLRRALREVRPVLTAAEAIARVSGQTVTYRRPDGSEATLNAGTLTEAAARQLVVVPRLVRAAGAAAPSSSTDALELRLAWEVALGGASIDAPAAQAYVDAVSGELLPAEAAAPAPTPTVAAPRAR